MGAEDHTREHSFDELARGLASGVPRRTALRLLGGALVGALLGSGPGRAWAATASPCARRRHLGTACPGGICLPPGGTLAGGPAVCCPRDSACQERGAERCCPEGETCTDMGCCTPERVCVGGSTGPSGTCCPPEAECVNGECVCPRGTTPAGYIPAEQQCCPKEKECLGDCCAPDEFCSQIDGSCTRSG